MTLLGVSEKKKERKNRNKGKEERFIRKGFRWRKIVVFKFE